jgi:N-carbamoyl-L-amino-acid hydrolase
VATAERSKGLGDAAQVLADLRALAQFGSIGRGVTRPAFSEPDMAARRWLAGRLADAGLTSSIDGIGNVVGRDPKARVALLAGSHSDSVPRGGWLDGALGVIFALEAARAWRRANPDAPVGIDVVSFADEEGTFDPCVGSRAFLGAWPGLPPDRTGPLAQAVAAAGLSGLPQVGIDRGRHKAFLEAHIEQGPRLEAGRIDIGVVVRGIVGMRRQRLRFAGQADHAGTTPMASRRDAGRAMVAFCAAIDAEFGRLGEPDAVWNMGVMSVLPGAANVVPSSAEVVVEYRHLDRAVIDRMTTLVRAHAANSPVPVTIGGGRRAGARRHGPGPHRGSRSRGPGLRRLDPGHAERGRARRHDAVARASVRDDVRALDRRPQP